MKNLRISTLHVSLILMMTALVFSGGCGTNSPEQAKPATAPSNSAATVPAEKKTLLTDKPVAWKADGVISDNEYVRMQAFGAIEVYSRIDGDTLRMALKAKSNGYVAIGFGPSERMKDADIILGFVKDGKAVLTDMYSTGPTGPHPPDDQQGGNNDITVFGGTKKDGITTIEFERKLVTGDSKDNPIKAGDNKIIWSVGDTESPSGKHIIRGSGVLKL